MTHLSVGKFVLAPLVIGIRGACSSGSDEETMELPLPDDVSVGGDNPESDPDRDQDPDPDTDRAERADVDLVTVPVFTTTTCDAAPAPEATTTRAMAAAPATLMSGTPGQGRLDPDSTTSTEHRWSVDLEAGIYHLIVENRLSSGRVGALALRVQSTDPSGAVLETLSTGNQLDYRMRELDTLTLDSARALRLKMMPSSPRTGLHDGDLPQRHTGTVSALRRLSLDRSADTRHDRSVRARGLRDRGGFGSQRSLVPVRTGRGRLHVGRRHPRRERRTHQHHLLGDALRAVRAGRPERDRIHHQCARHHVRLCR